MAPLHPDARMLIAVRVVVVTTLLIGALIIQTTVNVLLPINYLYVTAAAAYVLTLGYIAMARLVKSREANLAIQTAGDLLLETLLVYFTGGIDSPFSFLYLVSIITASMLLYRRGGLVTASGASILYGGLTDLMYYGLVPLPEAILFTPGPWTVSRLYLTMATNFAGFYATALLTAYVSEKLRKTYTELDVNRQNLAALRAMNQSVIESIPSGLITLSPRGTVLFINPAGCEILGLTVPEIVGKHIGADPLPIEWKNFPANMSGERLVRGEAVFLRAGEERAIGYAITPLRVSEQSPAGFALIFQDLTDMKALEAQVRLKDRMAAVGELSAGIAHEIRNPLAAISGSVQVLRNSSNLTPQEQRLMSIVLKESDRLNKSIADFLRFVRPQEKVPVRFDVALSLGETLDLLANSPELGAAHRIERHIEPPSFELIGDGDQIRQVFWNIAQNAIKAMPDGGTLEVSAEPSGGSYRIVFGDSGRGMTQADQRRLFQPFRTNFPSGTGLGMAISYRIVQEHGGHIDVVSIPGAGTRITIHLPITARAAAAAEG